MRILKEETIALAIDLQERLIPVISQREELIRNTIKLIEGLKVLEVPMVVTQQYPKGLGMTIDPIIMSFGEHCKYYDKVTFSCLDDQTIQDDLISYNKKNVIVFGIEAHVCVLQTAIDLIQEGYHVVIVEDCISSRNQHDKEIALQRMLSEGAVLTTFESILFELTRISGSDTFKAISKIVK